MTERPHTDRRIVPRLAWGFLLLAMLIGLWWWVRSRDDSAVASAGTMPTTATVVDAPTSRGKSRESAARPATSASLSPASQSKSAVPEPAPSAECIAARRRDAEEERRLTALNSAEQDALVESAARTAHEEERVAMRAIDACEGVSDAAAVGCLFANGLGRAREFLSLYRDTQDIQRAFLRHASRVAGRGDPRSLLAAAHILPFAEAGAFSDDAPPQRRPEAIEWLVRAQVSGRDDPVVQWGVLALRDFSQPPLERLRVARAAAAQRLLALEPDNAAVHLLSAQWAVPEPAASREAPTARASAVLDAAAFQRLAALPSYVNHSPAVATLILEALGDMSSQPAFRRLAMFTVPDFATETHCASDADILLLSHLTIAIGSTNATSPALVGTPCKAGTMAADAQLRRDCLAFSAQLHASAANSLERSVGTSIARLAATSDDDLLHWQRMHRRNRWQVEQFGRATRGMDPYRYARIMAGAWRSGNEASGMEAVLRGAGVPLDPPADWRVPGEPAG